jgi:hypothetical protein
MKYYNGTRTHLSLEKDAPISRAVDRAGHTSFTSIGRRSRAWPGSLQASR